MGVKSFLCLLASMVLLTSKVSSKDEEFFLVEGYYAKPPVSIPPVASPVKLPKPLPPSLYPPPPVTPKPPCHPTPSIAPPPQVPVKPPTPAPPPAPVPPKTRLDCIPLCVERCKRHSRKRLCARACMTCCERCKCVPPGTYGNREKCGKCYTDMTTHYGRRKCP